MTISVVQVGTLADLSGSGGSGDASFAADVTAGNSLIYAFTDYSGTNVVISSNTPTFAGSEPAGSVKLTDEQSPYSGGTVYAALWLLPDVAGGSKEIGITSVNGTGGANVGLIAWEVAGLGASPSADKSSEGSGNSTAVSSGASGAITASPEIIVGLAVGYGQTEPGAGAPWTETTFGSDFIYAGYQIAASSGGSYTYAMTGGSSAPWAALVATVKGPSGTSHTATAALTVTPSFTADTAHGHYRTAALTVTPEFTAARVQAHVRTAALTVTPVFRAVPSGGAGRPAVTQVPDGDEAREFKRWLLWDL
jgi:hypothetical protein